MEEREKRDLAQQNSQTLQTLGNGSTNALGDDEGERSGTELESFNHSKIGDRSIL